MTLQKIRLLIYTHDYCLVKQNYDKYYKKLRFSLSAYV